MCKKVEYYNLKITSFFNYFVSVSVNISENIWTLKTLVHIHGLQHENSLKEFLRNSILNVYLRYKFI